VPLDLNERLTYARRIIAQRCLYGVDKNPLAVEMAKLALAKDKPFEFLDHAIRRGDSLIGVHDLRSPSPTVGPTSTWATASTRRSKGCATRSASRPAVKCWPAC
jgi:hypothetical protein